MEEFEIDIVETKCLTNGAKIKAIGVGGGGENTGRRVVRLAGVPPIRTVANTVSVQAFDDLPFQSVG